MLILGIILTYLYAAIPFSLLVGIVGFKTDIRKEGSGNVGGSNLGRTCGKRAFIIGFALDCSKGSFAVLIATILNVNPLILFLAALIGHSFSVFIKFKGGKGVATAFGFGLVYTPLCALVAILCFIVLLKFSKYVSLSSMSAILIYCVSTYFIDVPRVYTLCTFAVWLIVVFLHRENIKRIINKTERKVTWI